MCVQGTGCGTLRTWARHNAGRESGTRPTRSLNTIGVHDPEVELRLGVTLLGRLTRSYLAEGVRARRGMVVAVIAGVADGLTKGQSRPSILDIQREDDTQMPTLDDVYRKFGEASEAAQLLETELGTLLLAHKCIDAGLPENPDPSRATAIYDQINKQTLGQLIRSLGAVGASIVDLERLLSDALASRNRLAHSFYLQHNFRRNSTEGHDVMLRDLEAIHESLLNAYKAVLLLSGVDVEKLVADHGDSALPSGHLPIRT